MRKRKFCYSTKTPDEKKLQDVICSYHIYGFQNGELHGVIIFGYGKTVSAASSALCDSVISIDTDIIEKISEIKTMSNVWENGPSPKKIQNIVLDSESSSNKKSPKNIINIQTLLEIVKEKDEIIRQKDEEIKKLQSMLFSQQNKSQPPVLEPIHNTKITNYLLHLNTNMKNANLFEDLILLFVFTSEDVAFYEKNGFINTVVTIFLRIISTYTIENRPIHTSDETRYNIYLHTKEGWIKETPNETPIFGKLIRMFTHKFHQQMVREYEDTPVNSSLSKRQFKYIEIFSQATTHDAEKNKMKIIKNIFKHLTIQ